MNNPLVDDQIRQIKHLNFGCYGYTIWVNYDEYSYRQGRPQQMRDPMQDLGAGPL